MIHILNSGDLHDTLRKILSYLSFNIHIRQHMSYMTNVILIDYHIKLQTLS